MIQMYRSELRIHYHFFRIILSQTGIGYISGTYLCFSDIPVVTSLRPPKTLYTTVNENNAYLDICT